MTPLYEIHDLKQSYGRGTPGLDIADLTIGGSGITGLVGPNGSGKSTLLKILSFLLPYDDGTLLYRGSPAAGRESALRREVTYLLQDSYLLSRSVYENIAFGLRLRGNIGASEIDGRVKESLARVGLDPKKFASRQWYQLSGGEVQRVALAARLALRPRVLLLDEPTANVDERSAQLIMEAAVMEAKEHGVAVIAATHDLAWLYEMSSEVVSLYRGRVAVGAENIFQGGWTIAEGRAARLFPGGQAIFATPPLSGEPSAAALGARDVRILTSRPTEEERVNVICARIVHMTLERALSSVLVSADAGGFMIRARVPGGAALCRELYPSREVFLAFQYAALRWL